MPRVTINAHVAHEPEERVMCRGSLLDSHAQQAIVQASAAMGIPSGRPIAVR